MANGKTYIVPTKAEPTFWNKEALIGTFLLPIPIVGTVAGGLIGKARMECEKDYGKPVDPPSIANKDAVIGGIIAFLPAAMMAAAVSALTGGAPILIALASMATVGMGALIGGAVGRGRLEKEYKEAEDLVTARDKLNIAAGKAPGGKVPPETAQKLASGINGGMVVGEYLSSRVASTVVGLIFQHVAPATPEVQNTEFGTNMAVSSAAGLGGAVVGGLVAKNAQERRYLQGDIVTREEALEVELAQRGMMVVPQRANQISAEEARLLEQRLAAAQGVSAQERISQTPAQQPRLG